MLSGDDGILNNTRIAKEKTETSRIQEQVQVSVISAIAESKGKLNDATLKNKLKNNIDGVTDSNITGNEKYGWQVKIGKKRICNF